MSSTRRRSGGHDPGRVLVDLAVAIADGAETITDLRVLADQRQSARPGGVVGDRVAGPEVGGRDQVGGVAVRPGGGPGAGVVGPR